MLDRTPFTTWGGYSGLALRGRPDWTDTRFLVADGTAHDRVLGMPSPWCDLSGHVDGTTAGVLVLDGPSNPRHPVPWYGSTKADTYGDEGWSNFVNAAFCGTGHCTSPPATCSTFSLPGRRARRNVARGPLCIGVETDGSGRA